MIFFLIILLLLLSLMLASLRGLSREIDQVTYEWLPRIYLFTAVIPLAFMPRNPLLVVSCLALAAFALYVAGMRRKNRRRVSGTQRLRSNDGKN